MNLKEIKELVEFLKEQEIAEFELERGDVKVRIKRASEHPPMPAVIPIAAPGAIPIAAPVAVAGSGNNNAASQAAPVAAVPDTEEAGLHSIKSPIVGTFYESPAPGAPPFVKIGDAVEAGQVLCIIEAMKLMNEIESDAAGEIVKKFASNGQPVEYGQVLFSIRPK